MRKNLRVEMWKQEKGEKRRKKNNTSISNEDFSDSKFRINHELN